MDTLLKNFLGKGLFDLGEGDELIEIFRTYVQNVRNTESYLSITDKIKSIPAENTLFKELKVPTIDQLNFDLVLKEYF